MQKKISPAGLDEDMPLSKFPEILCALEEVEKDLQQDFYVSGGTIRDLFLGRQPVDLDITVKRGSIDCCRRLLERLGGGALVMLGTKEEEAARAVWRGSIVDFSTFRKGAGSIEEDLQYRDFTINAMALQLHEWKKGERDKLIDPLQGKADLERGILRSCPGSFVDDPLRMLRGYRLQAELRFVFTKSTSVEIEKYCSMLKESAAERVHYELERIMQTSSAAKVIGDMAETGLLRQIFPELEQGIGVQQPGFHHEDVFHHNLLALQCLERVMERPRDFFHHRGFEMERYLESGTRRKTLRWSALFHDLGKPATRSSGTMDKDRITFYNHDRAGCRIFMEIAVRLRWSRAEAERVAGLIEMHMHPFHLSNVKREGTLSKKACLRICKRAGEDLAGLFMLAMADSLAGQGELKPDTMEEELAGLYDEIQTTNEIVIRPVLSGEKLVNGHDLILLFDLSPGPHFSRIFEDLEIARVEGEVGTRAEALTWLSGYLQKSGKV